MSRGGLRWKGLAGGLLATVLLQQGCIFTPQTTTVYDDECRVYAKHMTLMPGKLAPLDNCGNTEQCLAMLAGAGVVSAASVVVSGSIAVVGNMVYWLERQGECSQGSQPCERQE